MSTHFLRGYFLTLPLLYCAYPISNACAAQNDDNKTHWGVGLGAMVKEPAYTGYDRESKVLPIIFFDNKWVRLFGPNLDFKLGSVGDVDFALRAKFSLGDGYESSDAEILRGMEDRDASIWVGPGITWENDIVDVSAELLGDVMGNSEGQQASLDFSKTFRFGKRFSIEPSLGATWYSEDYVNYYYGVTAAEVRSDRAEFIGESTVVLNAGIRFGYNFDEHQLISLSAEINSFDQEIKDSPLVDQSSESRVALAYIYRF